MGVITDVSQIGVRNCRQLLSGVLVPNTDIILAPALDVVAVWLGKINLAFGVNTYGHDMDIWDVGIQTDCGNGYAFVTSEGERHYDLQVNTTSGNMSIMLDAPGCAGEGQRIRLRNNDTCDTYFWFADIDVIAGPVQES